MGKSPSAIRHIFFIGYGLGYFFFMFNFREELFISFFCGSQRLNRIKRMQITSCLDRCLLNKLWLMTPFLSHYILGASYSPREALRSSLITAGNLFPTSDTIHCASEIISLIPQIFISFLVLRTMDREPFPAYAYSGCLYSIFLVGFFRQEYSH